MESTIRTMVGCGRQVGSTLRARTASEPNYISKIEGPETPENLLKVSRIDGEQGTFSQGHRPHHRLRLSIKVILLPK